MNQLRILMMSPDETARAAAVSALLQAGISARGCSTSLELFGLLNGGAYDVVVLDVEPWEKSAMPWWRACTARPRWVSW